MNVEHETNINPIAKLVEYQKDAKLTEQANSTPLPGPLRDAFALKESISVGPYQIRPFVDRDFEYLQLMDSPLHHQMKDRDGDIDLLPLIRGQKAWDLCMLFTHPFKEIKSIIKSDNGQSKFHEMAGEEFDELDVDKMLAILKAVYRQLEIYWSPVISFKSMDSDDGVSKKNTLVDGADNLRTDSAFSLKSVA